MRDGEASDLLIVGGGVIGLAIAWRALGEGLSVRLLEREDAAAAQTSHVAAGMIAPVGEGSEAGSALLELSLASAARYPAFAADLEAETGLKTGYRRTGTLLLSTTEADSEAIEREAALRRTLGPAPRRLTPKEARRLEPALGPGIRSGLELPDDCVIDPRALSAALIRAVTRAGGDLRTGTEVSGLSVSREEVTGVRLDNGESLSAGRVIIAAGPWSGQIGGTPLGAQIPFRPVKGQILTLSDPSGPGRLERMLRMSGGYLVPRGDGRYVLGASVEERGFDRAITAGAVHELVSAAVSVVPDAGEWHLDELNSGIRPATVDDLPVIGTSPVLDRLVWATGHHRHGILLAPVTADLVLAEMTGAGLPEFAEAVSPERFRHLVGHVEVTG